MLAAVDVHYRDDGTANAAVVVFAAWPAGEPIETRVASFDEVADYVPGQFFRRELPCILPLLLEAHEEHRLTTIVVDGYVQLADGKPGLGMHLHEALPEPIEIVGVAKSPFQGAPAEPVLRGVSKRPLYVTSTGDALLAAEAVQSMAGESRIPTLLKLVDQLARGHVAEATGG